ncbi:MAG: hypothetical protein KA314_06235 [Chloroflexi bacterium]|nr:hypothetical protein [Chloroflexota bacterium]MBP8055421.1 hypothetical protein [Chloroflexota bacterium]
MNLRQYVGVVFSVLFLVACQRPPAAAIPTLLITVAAPGSESVEVAEDNAAATVPATWTPIPTPIEALPVFAAPPSRTPRPAGAIVPTNTRPPTAIATALPPSATPSPTPTLLIPLPFTAVATIPATTGNNLLPNASFENGWYNLNDIPELQVPNSWRFEWDAGDNPLDPNPWNDFVRPETRVLSKDFLPVSEHSTFIWSGNYTIKIFKGSGSISYRLLTDVFLEPGQYLFTIKVFPDLVVGYQPDGSKIWAPDPLSGEVQFLVDGIQMGWQLPQFGRRNTFVHTLTLTEGRTVTLGVWIRGRWAITNNGWFMDDWSLYRITE